MELLLTWALVDFLAIVYHIWNLIRLAILGAHLILVASFLVHEKIERELNRALRENLCLQNRATKNSHVSGRSKSSRVQHFQQPSLTVELQLLLRRFYREYRWLLALMGRFNDRLVSRLLLSNGFANLAINLVFVGSLLTKRNLAPAVVAAMALGTGGQTLVVSIIATGLTTIANSFYRSDRLLYRAQLTLMAFPITKQYTSFFARNGNEQMQSFRRQAAAAVATTLLAKLKLAVFYETVCTKDKFRFTVGSYTDISYRSMFEFRFVYSGFVMYVAKMIKRGQL